LVKAFCPMTQLEYSVPNINAERTEGQERAKKTGRVARFLGRIAVKCVPYAGVATIAAASYMTVDNASGTYKHYPPTTPSEQEWLAAGGEESLGAEEQDNDNVEEGTTSDGLRIGTWNMWNITSERLSEIDSLAAEYDLSVVALQEVSMDHVSDIREYFSDWEVMPVIADATPKPGKLGGFGNVFMMRHEPKHIETLSMDGTSTIENIKLAASGQFSQIQEKRAAMAVTFEVDDVEHVVITTHLSHVEGSAVQQRQMHELLEFIRKHTAKGRLTVICGDLNQRRELVERAFDEFGSEVADNIRFVVAKTESTFRGGKTLDYCIYTDGVRTKKSAESDKSRFTDHNPVVIEFGDFET
jgi:endonuclease/exonuclease/phosphatase family metal-dependent hydrolase